MFWLPNGVGRIASPGMLLDKFSPMTGAASPNRIGVADGGKDQHGRAARGGVGGGGALLVGQADGQGAHPRRVVRDDGLAPQACGTRAPAARDAEWDPCATRAQTHVRRDQAVSPNLGKIVPDEVNYARREYGRRGGLSCFAKGLAVADGDASGCMKF